MQKQPYFSGSLSSASRIRGGLSIRLSSSVGPHTRQATWIASTSTYIRIRPPQSNRSTPSHNKDIHNKSHPTHFALAKYLHLFFLHSIWNIRYDVHTRGKEPEPKLGSKPNSNAHPVRVWPITAEPTAKRILCRYSKESKAFT